MKDPDINIRDVFAAVALLGRCLNPVPGMKYANMAAVAYEVADAMIEARKSKDETE